MEPPVALVFAAAGAVGSAVARRLAADGFAVHVSGPSPDPVRALGHELGAPWAAIEGMTRSLAAELRAHGIRVNCVRAAGMPETRTIRETTAALRGMLGAPTDAPVAPPANALHRHVTPGDVATPWSPTSPPAARRRSPDRC